MMIMMEIHRFVTRNIGCTPRNTRFIKYLVHMLFSIKAIHESSWTIVGSQFIHSILRCISVGCYSSVISIIHIRPAMQCKVNQKDSGTLSGICPLEFNNYNEKYRLTSKRIFSRQLSNMLPHDNCLTTMFCL